MEERVTGEGTESSIHPDYTVLEGSDYLLDMETSFRNKKRRRVEQTCDAENSNLDEGYVSFLNDLQEYWEAKFVEEENDDDNDGDGDGDGDDDDPTYMAFLGNLKEHGNAYVCEVSIEHGVLSPIVYEMESDSSTEIKRKIPKSRVDTCTREKWSSYHDDIGISSLNKSGNDRRDGIKRTFISRGDDFVRVNRSLGVDKNQRAGIKYSKKTSRSVDETYGKFISKLHVKGDSVFFEYEDKRRVYYETSGQQKTNVRTRSPTLTPRPTTPSHSPPIPPSRVEITTKRKSSDGRNTLSSSDKKRKSSKQSEEEDCTWFWKELHKNLRKPYDYEEYKFLLKQFSTRTPVSIHRDSRSGGSDRPGKLGKSYLEYYPDLEREIDKVKSERPKVLNLLRMCNFYIQKIPSLKGKDLRPWKDEFSKTILPGSS